MEEIEKNVLGVILENDDYLYILQNEFKVDIFQSPSARVMAKTMIEMAIENEKIDQWSLPLALKKKGQEEIALETVELNKQFVELDNVKNWINILKERYARNQYLRVAELMRVIATDETRGLTESRNQIEKILTDLDDLTTQKQEPTMKESWQRLIDENKLKVKGEFLSKGIPTGFSSITNTTNGWSEGNFIVVGAKSGGGKSTLAMNFAINAIKNDYPTHFVSLEMLRNEIMLRIASYVSGIKYETLDRQGVKGAKESKYYEEIEKLMEDKLFIDADADLNLERLKFNIRKQARRFNTKLVIVDYIQLVHNKSSSREQAIAEIARSLKNLAMELQIAIIGLTQFNRELADEGEPMTRHIRESAGIENSADKIIFPYHDPESGYFVKIAKNRGGDAPVYVRVNWEKETFRFYE